MELGDLQSNLPFIILIVVLIVMTIVMRQRRSERSPVDIASALFMDLRTNLGIIETAGTHRRPRKLKVDSYLRNESKLEFLDDSLRRDLSTTFHLTEDYNRQVEAVKDYQQAGYMSIISVDKLKRSLINSQQGLEEWLRANAGGGQGQQTSQRQGCLFG
jgi:hypothetical protein